MGQPLKYHFILIDSEEAFSTLAAFSGKLSWSFANTPLQTNATRAQIVPPAVLMSKGGLSLHPSLLPNGEDLLSFLVHLSTKSKHYDKKVPSIHLAGIRSQVQNGLSTLTRVCSGTEMGALLQLLSVSLWKQRDYR